ncbi:MAG: nucleotidyltransferase domain-containing protein [Candidatus Pacearchaeota archaeon]|jgi:predicted nucleotidyltransferase
MEIQIKKTIKAGNSSAVVLPRAWLNKEVRVELIKKSLKTMLLESLSIVESYIPLKEIIGVYLVGSYAREEQDESSDIDILVITKNIDKEIINEGIYNILIISEELLNQKLEEDLFPIGQMIKEAVPLLNLSYLNQIKIKVTKKNVKWYLETTQDKISLTERILKTLKNKDIQQVDNRIIYTLILRIRTLEIIDKLIKNKPYSKKEFIELIKRVSKSTKPYEGYLDVKNNLTKNKKSNIEETEILLNYLKEQLIKVSKEVRN